MLLIVIAAVPVFDTVTVCPAVVVFNDELKLAEVGDTARTGAGTVPVSATVCDVAGAATFTASEAVLLPTEVGVNVTDTVQLAPTATLVPHPLTIAN